MISFNEDDIDALCKLCRIQCSDEEKSKLLIRLKAILAYLEKIKEINTENVLPCTHILPQKTDSMRADEVTPGLSQHELLSNSPSHVGGMIRVPPVMT